jgi:putative ABC transport system ATP-binding protein
MTELVVDAQHLSKVHGSNGTLVQALVDVNFELAQREFVALRGPSGSGKSTLLSILGCLDRPTSGRYLLGGTDVSALDRGMRAWVRLHYLGFVFQSFHLIPDCTALENVVLPLHYAGVPRAEREARAASLLERVGLGARAGHVPAQLSGGERQRVAIARSLACRPPLLLADEPTGALDTHTGNEILDLLLSLREKEGVTVLLVTHDPAIAARADRQVFICDGRLSEVATHEERRSQ